MIFQPGRKSEKSWPKLGSPDINVAIECSILTTTLNTTVVFGWKGKHASWFLKHYANSIDIFQKIANANGKYTVLGILQKQTPWPCIWYIPLGSNRKFPSERHQRSLFGLAPGNSSNPFFGLLWFVFSAAKKNGVPSEESQNNSVYTKKRYETTRGSGHSLVSTKTNLCKPITHPVIWRKKMQRLHPAPLLLGPNSKSLWTLVPGKDRLKMSPSSY